MFWRIFTGLVLLSVSSLAEEVKLILLDVTVGEFETSMLLPEGFQFSPGMAVYLSFAVGGYTINAETNGVNLAYTVEAFDCLGHSFGRPVSRRYSRRFPLEEIVAPPVIRTRFVVPQFVYPGQGKFRVSVTDLTTRAVVRQEIEFELRSTLPEPSGAFEILDMRPYRDNPDTPVSVFHAGEVLSLRFLLAGFGWREAEAEYDLRYGLAVVGANGRVVMNVPEAVAESNPSQYRKAYVPAAASVQLEKSIRAGQYSLIVTATDGVTNKQTTASTKFQVE